jgi:CRISPR type I-E-associated protein CasB/Cse2
MNAEAQSTEPVNITSVIGSIAALLGSGGAVGVGDVAALRRMNPHQPEAAFFKIEGLVLDALLPGSADARADLETRWAAIVAGLAHLEGLHRPGIRLGEVLAAAQYSELRFARLVRSDAERLADELPMLARFLAAKSTPVDWTGAAHLILSAGGPSEQSVRRHVARDYYGALARLESR